MSGNPPGRIVYVTTHYPSLSQTFVFNEIAGLERLGWEVLPVSLNSVPEADLTRPGFARESARTLYIKAQPKGRILAVLVRALRANPRGFLRTLGRAVGSGGTDAKRILWRVFHFVEAMVVWDHCRTRGVYRLHAHFAGLPSMLGFLAVEFGRLTDPDAPWDFSFTVHGGQEIADDRDSYLRAKVKAASSLVVISDFTSGEVKRQIDPTEWDRVQVVRCGIQFDRFRYDPVIELPDPPIVLTVARLSPEKGHLILIDAIDELRRRGERVTAEFIGGGPFADDLQRRIDELGLNDRITLLGSMHTDEVAKRLPTAAVFCLPSFAEGIPVSIMEAMAVGVPVVATKVGGVGELVTDEVSGLLVSPGRVDQLADALHRMLTDRDLRAQVVATAVEAVHGAHDWELTARELSDRL